jgi:hypothetical protein
MVSGDRKAAPPHLVDASIARQMSGMIKAFRISQIVGTIAQLGIPDKLASGAKTTGELASLIGCHAEATHRLMRAACELGRVASGPDARFMLTALGAVAAVGCARVGAGLGHRIDLSRPLAAMGTLE